MSPPTTPPSTVKAAHKIRDVPCFSIPDEGVTWKTPLQRHPCQKTAFLTPTSAKPAANLLATPATNKNALFDTPHHSQSSPATPLTGSCSAPKNAGISTSREDGHQLTPEHTPALSPRHPKRRRLHLDEFFQSSSDSIASLLLPTHSVVGSGRKALKNNHISLRAPISLDFSELSKLNENLAFEDDSALQHGLESSPSASRGRRVQHTGPLARVPEAHLQPGVSYQNPPLPKHPVTPKNQLLSDSQVEQWYGKSYRGHFSDDEDSDEAHTIENPFLDAPGQKEASKSRACTRGNPFNSKSAINYDTHFELINHKTGERRVELLSESQRKTRPKRLDFSNV